jgi:hypothetical protein
MENFYISKSKNSAAIVESKHGRDPDNETIDFFVLKYEHVPFESNADNLLMIRMLPLKVIVNTEFIGSVLNFFYVEEENIDYNGFQVLL